MQRRFQFGTAIWCLRGRTQRMLFPFLALFLFSPMAARAQNAAPAIIGSVEGRDISCENGTPLTGGSASFGNRLDVSDGTVVTVHSGQARMTLVVGGEVDICGPAKLTVLLSGDAITLALNFGRVRVLLPQNTTLRIFTPTIIGTPIDISGGARDVTVGLSLDDSLCVTATSGAIQLEHQFTGERLIVPQAGEFFLNSGKLLPVAGTPGSCQCVTAPAPARVSPDYAAVPKPPVRELPPIAIIPPPAPNPEPAAMVEVQPPAAPQPPPEPEQKVVEYSQLAQANEAHPVIRPVKEAEMTPPPSSDPIYTAVLPPLTFMAGNPLPPPAPTADMVLLLREARVAPEWEFRGRVEAPEFAKAMQNALGENGEKPQTNAKAASHNPAAEKPKKQGGFWAALKRMFGGGTVSAAGK